MMGHQWHLPIPPKPPPPHSDVHTMNCGRKPPRSVEDKLTPGGLVMVRACEAEGGGKRVEHGQELFLVFLSPEIDLSLPSIHFIQAGATRMGFSVSKRKNKTKQNKTKQNTMSERRGPRARGEGQREKSRAIPVLRARTVDKPTPGRMYTRPKLAVCGSIRQRS